MANQQFQFKPAQRKKAKARIAISSPSGGGKTMGALLIAKGLGGKIAVIDTENGSASLYSGMDWCPDFDALELTPPYSPERYIEAIALAESSGFDVIIIDSATHEWNGSGGCLEINDMIAATECRGNTWSAWNKTTPRHRKFIDKMLQSPCHIISTMRSKTDTAQQEVNGRKTIVKLGLKSEQRDGIEYEFTVVLDIIHDGHWATASKDRTGLFLQPEVITEKTGERLREWLENGIDAEAIEKKKLEDEKRDAVSSICCAATADQLKSTWESIPNYLKIELNSLKDFKKSDILFNGSNLFWSKENQSWNVFADVPERYESLIQQIDACHTLEELETLGNDNVDIKNGALKQYYTRKIEHSFGFTAATRKAKEDANKITAEMSLASSTDELQGIWIEIPKESRNSWRDFFTFKKADLELNNSKIFKKAGNYIVLDTIPSPYFEFIAQIKECSSQAQLINVMNTMPVELKQGVLKPFLTHCQDCIRSHEKAMRESGSLD